MSSPRLSRSCVAENVLGRNAETRRKLPHDNAWCVRDVDTFPLVVSSSNHEQPGSSFDRLRTSVVYQSVRRTTPEIATVIQD
jgi:hypothetical protein